MVVRPSESATPSDDTVTLITASRRYQIAVGDLALGMYVAELDRPWLDTPFLLQGFVVDSPIELDTLRRCCEYVYVDLELSSPGVADAIRRAEVRPGDEPTAPADGGETTDAWPSLPTPPTVGAERARPGPPRVYRTRADVRISTDTRQRFRQLVRATSAPATARDDDDDGLLRRAFGWIADRLGTDGRPGAGGPPDRDRAAREALRAWLPPEVRLLDHPATATIGEELPRARLVIERAEEALKVLAADVKVGRLPKLTDATNAVDGLVESLLANPDALLWVGRMRDGDANALNHGVRVALYLIAFGRHLGLPRRELGWLGRIGLLADVGKVRLPRALLDKPGMLAPGEFNLIKEHVRLGLDAMRAAGTLPPEVEAGIAQHHERLDGTGYPRGLKGNEIGLWGRMAGIVDSFAALITPRAYASPLSPQDALMSLVEWAGSSFHEPLVEQFVQAVGVFPVGTLVELSTGEIAAVVANHRERRLEPKVLVLTWPDRSSLEVPVERDLLRQDRRAAGRVRVVRGLAAGVHGLKTRDWYLGEVERLDGVAA